MNPQNPNAILVRQSTATGLWEVIHGNELVHTNKTKNNAWNFAKDYAEGLPGVTVSLVEDRKNV